MSANLCDICTVYTFAVCVGVYFIVEEVHDFTSDRYPASGGCQCIGGHTNWNRMCFPLQKQTKIEFENRGTKWAVNILHSRREVCGGGIGGAGRFTVLSAARHTERRLCFVRRHLQLSQSCTKAHVENLKLFRNSFVDANFSINLLQSNGHRQCGHSIVCKVISRECMIRNWSTGPPIQM